jgi:uncharacterized membrane protein
MLQIVERADCDGEEAGAAAASARLKVTTSPVDTQAEVDDGLLAAAGPIMMAAYAVVLTVAILAFKADGEALLMVAISIVFAVMYFGVPLTMMRVRTRQDARWRKDGATRNGETVEICTGPMRRTEAVVQMVIVPLVVSAAFVAFAAIRSLVRG